VRHEAVAVIGRYDLRFRQVRGNLFWHAEFVDIENVVDFFIRPESAFVTGQVIYLGGVS
jgi:hypothetical protein